jgi:hypothetical protein
MGRRSVRLGTHKGEIDFGATLRTLEGGFKSMPPPCRQQISSVPDFS